MTINTSFESFVVSKFSQSGIKVSVVIKTSRENFPMTPLMSFFINLIIEGIDMVGKLGKL